MRCVKCLILCALIGINTLSVYASDTLTIVSYNVENFFDNRHDTLKNDLEFTAEGDRHWTYRRFQSKAEHIAQVLVGIRGWQAPCLVGLCEVENERCLRSLCWHLRTYRYKSIHYESPDERGIDVALLYDSTAFQPIHTQPIKVDLPQSPTRDILYVQGLLPTLDTLHLYVCHMPSQRGGTAATEWKRKAAKQVLQHHLDSVRQTSPNADIVIMGDMNSAPADDLDGVRNMMNTSRICIEPSAAKPMSIHGTHKYQGIWTYLDQFYVSPSLSERVQVSVFAPEWLLEEDVKYLGVKPKRTFYGFKYQDGYSDHLPIVLRLIHSTTSR